LPANCHNDPDFTLDVTNYIRFVIINCEKVTIILTSKDDARFLFLETCLYLNNIPLRASLETTIFLRDFYFLKEN
jgi:hypothetical protein